MRIADVNLQQVLESLTPAERGAVEDCFRAARLASEEAIERLKAATLHKIKARLKAKARRQRDKAKHRWLM